MEHIKKDFPFLNKDNNDQPVIYLDNAATAHKPQIVIDRISSFYGQEYGTIFRGVHASAERATALYEDARANVARFIGAKPNEIIFTRGATEGINMVATAWAREKLQPGDEILITQMEHHANLIPWQQVARHTGAILKYIPVTTDGILDLTSLDQLITDKTKIVAVVHVSNVLGTHNDIKKIIDAAHKKGAKVLVDAAQSVAHQPIDVEQLGVDFLVFSGHKMFGPTGIGVLYINSEMHEQVDPYQFGGGMPMDVTLDTAVWQKSPHKYEAGTPPIAQAIGLSAAIDYMRENINFEQLQKHEAALCARFIEQLSQLPRIIIIGPVEQLKERGHLVSFVIDGLHAHDAAAYLDQYGIAVRAGHCCAQPVLTLLGVDAVIRVSFAAYNSTQDVDRCVSAISALV